MQRSLPIVAPGRRVSTVIEQEPHEFQMAP
jgi:hypothetical protein